MVTDEQTEFPAPWCRSQFPALSGSLDDEAPVFFDGPAGSQVPERVVQAVSHYLTSTNANHGGVFATSRQSDALLEEAHAALADLLGAADPHEIAFGANMTTLTLGLSRALARTWKPGDQILVTQLDHDANVTPWVLAAQDAGVCVERVGIRPDDCTLDLDDLHRKLTSKTRLVAVGAASNAVGTINPVAQITKLAHEAGAQVVVDAVHYAPHRMCDVQAWRCDYLLCSAYKFFGPHVGILWGRRELLEELPTYKVRPAPDDLPGRWMTGTQSHEGIAGAAAAVEYLADLGRWVAPEAVDRRSALVAAFEAIAEYETSLCRDLLAGLAELPGIKVLGIRDLDRLGQRVPTIGLTHERLFPIEIAQHLARHKIFVWHGNFYALSLTEALGLEPHGMVRIGLLHYNTRDEIRALLDSLKLIC